MLARSHPTGVTWQEVATQRVRWVARNTTFRRWHIKLICLPIQGVTSLPPSKSLLNINRHDDIVHRVRPESATQVHAVCTIHSIMFVCTTMYNTLYKSLECCLIIKNINKRKRDGDMLSLLLFFRDSCIKMGSDERRFNVALPLFYANSGSVNPCGSPSWYGCERAFPWLVCELVFLVGCHTVPGQQATFQTEGAA